jgi:hypothetical protein
MNGVSALGGAAGMIIIVFFIILAILWIVLPFLVSGINKRLDKLNANVVKIGKLLKEQHEDSNTPNTD